jgi:hypothetical protein
MMDQKSYYFTSPLKYTRSLYRNRSGRATGPAASRRRKRAAVLGSSSEEEEEADTGSSDDEGGSGSGSEGSLRYEDSGDEDYRAEDAGEEGAERLVAKASAIAEVRKRNGLRGSCVFSFCFLYNMEVKLHKKLFDDAIIRN